MSWLVVKTFMVGIVKNTLKSLFGKQMLFWGAEWLAKRTDTSIDDNIVKLVKAADRNDSQAIQQYAKNIIEELGRGR